MNYPNLTFKYAGLWFEPGSVLNFALPMKMVPAFPTVVRHLNRTTNMLVLVDAQGRLHTASQWACVRYTNGRVRFADAIRQAKHRPMIHQYFKSLKGVALEDVDPVIREVLRQWRTLRRASFELWLEVIVPNYEI